MENLLVNFVDPFMSKVPEEDVHLCWGILVEEGYNPGTRENEDHLFTLRVLQAALRLKDQVTCDDIAKLTEIVFMIDSMTSAAITRRKDRSKMWARNTFVHRNTGELTDILLAMYKDDESKIGRHHTQHVKHDKIKEVYAVMIILGRAVLRLHGHVLDKAIAPLDSEGHELSIDRRAELFHTMGEFHGIPRFEEQVLRATELGSYNEREEDGNIQRKLRE